MGYYIVSSEVLLEVLAYARVLWAATFALLYGLGGIHVLALRRYAGPLWLGFGIYLFGSIAKKWSPYFLLQIPLLMMSLSLGYGADTTWDKILLRLRFALAVSASSIPLAYISGRWLLWSIYCAMCCGMYVALGVWSPTPNARDEETILGLVVALLPLFLQ